MSNEPLSSTTIMPSTTLKNGSTDEVIAQALSEVNETAQRWSDAVAQDHNGDDPTAAVAQTRLRLTEQVWRLYSAVKGPTDMIHDHLEKVCLYGMCTDAQAKASVSLGTVPRLKRY